MSDPMTAGLFSQFDGVIALTCDERFHQLAGNPAEHGLAAWRAELSPHLDTDHLPQTMLVCQACAMGFWAWVGATYLRLKAERPDGSTWGECETGDCTARVPLEDLVRLTPIED